MVKALDSYPNYSAWFLPGSTLVINDVSKSASVLTGLIPQIKKVYNTEGILMNEVYI